MQKTIIYSDYNGKYIDVPSTTTILFRFVQQYPSLMQKYNIHLM